MQRLVIRRATDADIMSIANLVNVAYRPAAGDGGWTHESELVDGARTSPSQVAEALQRSQVLVGQQDRRIVACVQIELKGRQAHIGMLAVLPELQAEGVGRCMLREAERYAVAHSQIEELVLLVVSARKELIAYYRRRGYEETGERLAYPAGLSVGTPRSDTLDLGVLIKRTNPACGQVNRAPGKGRPA